MKKQRYPKISALKALELIDAMPKTASVCSQWLYDRLRAALLDHVRAAVVRRK